MLKYTQLLYIKHSRQLRYTLTHHTYAYKSISL